MTGDRPTPARALRLDLEYDGAAFLGWAVQPGRRTVEGVLREALDRLPLGPYDLRVAGRTDAGVHASAQVVSLAAARADGLPAERVRRALAALLPPDVVARGVAEAPPGFDARRDARSRTYEYRVLPGDRSPLRRHRVLHHRARLDPEALAAGAALVVGRHDFRAFTPTQTAHAAFVRTVARAEWAERGDELVFTIEAGSFLRRMARILVGTLLLVGRGAWPPERLAPLLAGAPRGAAGPTAPAHALTLVAVRY